jgi:DNA repair protein RecO
LYADFTLVRGKKMDTVAGSFVLDPFLTLRGSFERVLSASVIAEITDRMTVENYRDERVFQLLQESFTFLDRMPEAEKLFWLLILFFEVNFLSLSGFAPQAERCVFCLEKMPPGNNFFSFSLGGVLDSLCAGRIPDAVRVEDDVIRLLRFLTIDGEGQGEYVAKVREKLDALSKVNVKSEALFRAAILMKNFIEFNIDRPINAFETYLNFARERI